MTNPDGGSRRVGAGEVLGQRVGLSLITIPMRGRADSLNVSVSASILLYSVRSSALTVEPGLTGSSWLGLGRP
jgi:hypothetical protein